MKNISLLAVTLAALAVASHGFVTPLEAQGGTPAEAGKNSWAGVVVSLHGTASAAPPEGKPIALTGIDWIPEGAVVLTRDSSELILALSDGSRFRFGPAAKARVSKKGLLEKSGPIEALGSLSPIPDIAPLVKPVPGQMGAVRIRSAVVRGLYPALPYKTLADATTLSYERPEGNSGVKVEIENEAGDTVFETRTQAYSLRLPAGILRSGERYFWRVRTIGRPGPAAEGSAEFETVSSETAAAREQLHATVRPGDTAALTLAAEVDRQLGLLREAREGFARVLELEPQNQGISQTLAKLDAEQKALLAAP